MAITSGIAIILFLVISWIIIHFGANPDKGGSPPSDSRVIIRSAVMVGFLLHIMERELIVVEWLFMIIVKIDRVIVMYRIRLRIISVGL